MEAFSAVVPLHPDCKSKCRQKRCATCLLCTKKQCPRGCKCVDANVSSIIGTSRKGKWVPSIRNGIDVRSVPLPLSARVLSQDINPLPNRGSLYTRYKPEFSMDQIKRKYSTMKAKKRNKTG